MPASPIVTRRMAAATLPVAMIWLAALSGCGRPATQPGRLKVKVAARTFNLELAMDQEAWSQGLSDRSDIASDGGMLFVFDRPAPRQFVMRRCYVPIDLIYLDANGYVVAMHEMTVEPDPLAPDSELRRYRSTDPAQYAIELRGRTIRELGLNVADRIELPRSQLEIWVQRR